MNKNNDATEDTIIVFKDEYDVNDMTCSGYTLLNGNLNYEEVIDEDYAWDNDVWVIGEAEFLNQKLVKFVDENPNSGGTRPNTSLTRLEGRAEYGGIIQITDRGAVEPWFNGKFEIKYIVFSATGAKIKE
ncbi:MULTISPECIES: hypothetical protein [unclassified Polaribacter]|uniref:hypothetical protein n=1 Tax=unclassified Polaribacter TaxID=196858 RepID=UPI0011BE7AFF|nr:MULTISPECIES: hypothetical protein [unclassified Polaribacter]TXD53502.1 hypothetical protein ES043_03715 [Polaribacter sp. IC063]TXD58350.1 hypothetical protein ES044_12485 [Polaribacter sp. IC066]